MNWVWYWGSLLIGPCFWYYILHVWNAINRCSKLLGHLLINLKSIVTQILPLLWKGKPPTNWILQLRKCRQLLFFCHEVTNGAQRCPTAEPRKLCWMRNLIIGQMGGRWLAPYPSHWFSLCIIQQFFWLCKWISQIFHSAQSSNCRFTFLSSTIRGTL